MKTCVVDASVAVKWFLQAEDERLVEQAMELLNRHQTGEVQFMVPDIFWAETGNIFWKAVRTERCSRQKAESGLAELQAGEWITIPSHDLLDQAFQIALEFRRTVCDSLYVALASEFKSELITADEKLVRALTLHQSVKWLGAI